MFKTCFKTHKTKYVKRICNNSSRGRHSRPKRPFPAILVTPSVAASSCLAAFDCRLDLATEWSSDAFSLRHSRGSKLSFVACLIITRLPRYFVSRICRVQLARNLDRWHAFLPGPLAASPKQNMEDQGVVRVPTILLCDFWFVWDVWDLCFLVYAFLVFFMLLL